MKDFAQSSLLLCVTFDFFEYFYTNIKKKIVINRQSISSSVKKLSLYIFSCFALFLFLSAEFRNGA